MVSAASVKAGRAFVVFEVLDKTAKGMAAISGRLDRMSRRIGNVGRQLAFIGAAISVPFVMAINSAKDLTDELLKLQAILKIDDSAMMDITKTIRGLGKATSFTSIQVAEAATNLGRGGFSSPEIQKSLKNVLDLARTGSLSMADAANVMIRSMRTFDIEASQAESVADAFFVAASSGATTVADLAQAMRFSAGTASQLGFSLQETLGILSGLSNVSLNATIAGTSLNQMFLGLINNVEKLKAIGIDPIDVNTGELKTTEQLFLSLARVLKDLPSPERVSVLTDIFNVRGARAGIGIVTQLDTIIDNLGKLEISAGRAAEASAKMDSSIGGSIRRIISASTDLKESIGLAFVQSFKDLEKALIPLLNRLSNWAAQNEDLFVQIAKGAIVITTLGVALIGLAGVLGIIGGIIGGIGTLFSVLSGAAGTTALVIVAAGAQLAVVGALILSVWDDVKEGVFGLLALIKQRFAEIVDIVTKSFSAFKSVLKDIDFKALLVNAINLATIVWSVWVEVIAIALKIIVAFGAALVGILVVAIKAVEIAFNTVNEIIQMVIVSFTETDRKINTLGKDFNAFGSTITKTVRLITNPLTELPLLFGNVSSSVNETTEAVGQLNTELESLEDIRESMRTGEHATLPPPGGREGALTGFDAIARFAGRKGRPPTKAQIKTEAERREKVSNLQQSRTQSLQDRDLEDKGFAQSQKEQMLERGRAIQQRKNDLLELHDIELSFSRETDEKKKEQLREQHKQLSEQLKKQAENEINNARQAALAESERLLSRRRETERILKIEREIISLGGRLGKVAGVGVAGRGRTVSEEVRTDPLAEARRGKLAGFLGRLAEHRARVEKFRETAAGGSARASVGLAMDSSTVSALQTAFGNREEQKQSALLKLIDKRLEEVAKREAEVAAALRAIPVAAGA